MGQRPPGAAIPALIFDTDVLVAVLRGIPGADAFVRDVPFEDRSVSVFGFMELVQGCRSRHELNALERFVHRNLARIVPGSVPVADAAVSLLRRHALSDGLRMGDALIAASALATRARLATGNLRHYSRIRGLVLVPFHPVKG